MAEEYSTIQIRFFKRDAETGRYPVEALVDGGGSYSGQLDIDLNELLALQDSPQAYGLELFYGLFAGPMRRAYDFVVGRADSQSDGRLRVRLQIDDAAPELHAVRWEALHHVYRGEEVPLAISATTPFSRYNALEASEAQPLRPPLRLLFAIANPSDLAEGGLEALEVEAEIRSLLAALGEVSQPAQLQVKIMPGRTELSEALLAEPEAAGWEVVPGATSLNNLTRHLPDCHIFHFLGHGAYSRSGEQAALVMEREEEEKWGKSERVADSRLADRLRPLNNLRLVFLAACESARRDTEGERPNPYVGLAPKLVQAGVPAVVAMQDEVEMGAARQLAAQFYGDLLEHGRVDRALNKARYTLYSDKNEQWTIPALYMRLADGQLYIPPAPAVRYGVSREFLEPPDHYVSRPLVSERLQEQLLHGAGAPAITLLHGMAASGKTTFARALAQAVWLHFKSGVLWVTLGQEPELLNQLAELIQELEDYEFRPTTVEGASRHLGGLLAERQVLLVLDDAWEYEDAAPFLVGGPRCHVLITSRRAGVIGDYAGRPTIYRLRQLTERQALDMLAMLLDRTTDPPFSPKEREQALAFANAVGRLPLALELASRRIADGSSSWREMSEALETEIAKLEALDPDVRRRLKGDSRVEASINLSLRWLRADFEPAWESLVWLGVLPEDTTISAPAAATLWQVSPEEAGEILTLLDNENLLLEAPAQQIEGRLWPAYALHDLVHDVARRRLTDDEPQGLGLTLPQANTELLNRYQELRTSNLWHTLPADGYVQANLTWHMEHAGQIEEIHQLLKEETEDGRNGWYLVPDPPDKGNAYTAGVYRAWRLSEKAYEDQQSGKTIGRQCRYALINASLNSLAGNLPPELLYALVKYKVWSPQKALAHIEQIPKADAAKKAEALERLAPLMPLELLPQVLAVAQAIEGEGPRAKGLTALVSQMPEEEHEQILGQALAAAQVIEPEDSRVYALAALAPQLPEELMPQALTAAQDFYFVDFRIQALASLAPYLPQELLSQALAAAQAIRDVGSRAKALAALAPHLPKELWGQTLAAAQAMSSAWDRSQILVALTPQLPGKERTQILEQALSTARAIESGWHRSQILIALVSQLPEEERAQILEEVLVAAQAVKSEGHRSILLATLAPHLPDEVLSQALAAAQAIKFEGSRAEALASLVPQLPEELLSQALVSVQAIKSEGSRAEALASLAPHLPEEERARVLDEALVAIQAIKSERVLFPTRAEDPRAVTLTALAPHLPEELLPQALAAAQAIESEGSRVKVLALLISHLPEEERTQVLAEVLVTVRAIEYERSRTTALADLAPYLPEELLPQALIATQTIEDEFYQVYALANLAPHLPRDDRLEIVKQALVAGQAIRDERLQAPALAALAPHLSEEVVPQALVSVQAIRNERYRAVALTALAPRLPEEVVPQALVTVQAIRNEQSRAEALAALAPHLLEEMVPQALSAAQAIDHEWSRVNALVALAPYLPEELLPQAVSAAQAIRNEQSRAKALVALTPHLPETERLEIIRQALSAAQVIDYERSRAEALTALTPHLPETERFEIIRQAFAAAQAIRGDRERSDALTNLIPHLPQVLLPQALSAAQVIKDGQSRSKALSALVPYLPEEERARVLDQAQSAAQAIEDERSRSKALAALIPNLPGEKHARILDQALSAAQAIRSEQSRVEALVALAPQLLEGSLPQVLSAAQAIEEGYLRAQVLTALAPLLAGLPQGTLYALWSEALPVLARRTRQDLLAEIRSLLPVIETLGGREALGETAEAVLDVGRWWP